MSSENLTPRTAIVGCGWVGKALVPSLLQLGHEVIATTRSNANLDDIERLGAKAIQLQLPSKKADAFNFLIDVDTLIISLTPQFKHGNTDYPDKVHQLVAHASTRGVGRIILLSSTGIYQGLSGNVNEQSDIDTSNDKVAMLYQAEQAVLNAKISNSVLRLAGLVGPKRHPARFLAGKLNVINPQTPVNLVHQADVVNAILLMMTHREYGGIYNVVSETHPPRQKFYQLACRQLGLPAPNFGNQQESTRRIVCGDKIINTGFVFTHPNLITWLEN